MSAPVATGTGLFIGAFGAIVVWFWALSGANYITKDSFKYVSF